MAEDDSDIPEIPEQELQQLGGKGDRTILTYLELIDRQIERKWREMYTEEDFMHLTERLGKQYGPDWWHFRQRARELKKAVEKLEAYRDRVAREMNKRPHPPLDPRDPEPSHPAPGTAAPGGTLV